MSQRLQIEKVKRATEFRHDSEIPSGEIDLGGEIPPLNGGFSFRGGEIPLFEKAG